MADPLSQAVAWTVALLREFGPAIALGVGGYWAFLLYQRAFRSDTDPSYRKQTTSAVGTMGVLVSGAFFSALLAGVIAFVTWPAPMETPALGALLVGGVVFHAAVEKREAMMA